MWRSAPFDFTRSRISKRCCVDRASRHNFCNGECVALSNKVESDLKLIALPYRRHLLCENLLASGAVQIAKLRFHARDLIKGARPRIADFQSVLLSQLFL
jgi:hypothetical protein